MPEQVTANAWRFPIFWFVDVSDHCWMVCVKEQMIINNGSPLEATCIGEVYIENGKCEFARQCLNLDCKLNNTTAQTWANSKRFKFLTKEEIENWKRACADLAETKTEVKRILQEAQQERDKTKIENLTAMVSTTRKQTTRAGGLVDHYGIYEIIQPIPHNPPLFAVQEKKKVLAYLTELQIPNANTKVSPYERVPWLLPNEPLDYESTDKLFDEIRQCLYTYLETPRPEDFTILTAWILHTWTIEKFQTTPYLFFYGPFECGKTRALELLQQLGFRSWLVTGITSANLYRPIEEWKPTILLDETETFMDKPEILGILNSGYKRGLIVPRQVQSSDGSFTSEWFDLFSPKAMAGTEDTARTTKSRCITFKMAKATRKIPTFINKEDCTKLRNKLLKFRFDVLLGEGGDESEGFPGCEGIEERLSGRLLELFLPLLQITPTKYQKEIIEYAQNLAEERLREMGLSEEAIVLQAILECEKLGIMKNRMILCKHIADRMNQTQNYQKQWSNQRVGQIIGRLGFERQHTKAGNALIWNENLIKKSESDARYRSAFHPIEVEDKDTHPEKPSLSSPPSPEWAENAKEVQS